MSSGAWIACQSMFSASSMEFHRASSSKRVFKRSSFGSTIFQSPKLSATDPSSSTLAYALTSVLLMEPTLHAQPPGSPWLAWLSGSLAGIAAPAIAMLLFVDASAPDSLVAIASPIVAIGLMGTGMIAAAAAGRLWVGVLLALLTGTGLVLIAFARGLPIQPHFVPIGIAVVIASISFAARGALFARSASDKGWWIAVFVVAGEAAVVLTAVAEPGALPDWLLALLPAQWASIAIQTALTGTFAASSALIALGGTAAATLLVTLLWPRRWPYLIMFTTWLGLSALVYHSPHF